MSKNLIKKGLAFGTVLALGVTGLTSVAANAAAGDVTLAPTAGTKYGSLTTDSFSVKTTVSGLVNPSTLAYEISNPDKTNLYFKVADGSLTNGQSVTLEGFNSLGARVDMDSLDTSSTDDDVAVVVVEDHGTTSGFGTAAGDTDEVRGEFEVDFAKFGITKLVIRSISSASRAAELVVQPIDDKTTNNDSGRISGAITSGTNTWGPSDAFELGDGGASITIRSWVETEATADYSTVDAAYASDAQQITFVDPKAVTIIPRVENFVKADNTALLNEAGAVIAGSLELPSNINLDQVDVSKIVLKNGSTALTETYAAPAGFSSLDAAGRLYFTATETSTLDTAISLNVAYNDAAATTFTGVSYTPVAGTSDATVVKIKATVTDSANAIQTAHTDGSIELRPATKSFTFKSQVTETTIANDKAVSSVRVFAVVQATSYLSATGNYTVSGANGSIAKVNRASIVSGLTDAKGQFSVTVTSATALEGEAFKVTFYVIKSDGTKVASTAYTGTYTAAAVSTLSADNDVLSGSTVTVKFTVKDTYSQATAKSGADSLFIRVQASNTSKLDKDVVVGADGTATLTFTNYVTTGGSDNITANVYKGTASVPGTVLATKVLTLFNPAAVASVNAPATITTNITYDDFVTGAESATVVGPNDGNVALAGTVVDAASVGVPGAVVTVAGKGLQFKKTGESTWYQDSITLNADAGGNYSVTLYSHVVNTTGVAVTVTSGGKSASTTLKTYLPENLSGSNLAFSWSLPSYMVKNTTYAVTAKLTDKWGNPVSTKSAAAPYGVSFQGNGSVEINSSANAVTKNFDKNGLATVFVRSIKDIAGPGSITATLGAADYTFGAAGTDQLAVAAVTTDDTATKWDETKFANELSANVNVLESAPVVSATVAGTTGSVNVTVRNAAGKAVTVTINGRVYTPRLPSAAAQWYTFRGFSAGAKSVVVKVAGKTVATRTVTVK
ncbi:hypothetical protein [Candidatus Rhodoluna planktonica]|uniref:Big-1 domain-containing protein n=1 Tax=Candidatus Rhodoluna planktonica TaxID=535712 RepID=A0A1D9E0E9_9MICO|nr:hypothetical protein [Candidatus Rhodoluna planktonica]AOY56538.1 hypothetical protein A4Z71_06230 [Candidatus Rhodoluna planktonica]